jgi:hypothetical protein
MNSLDNESIDMAGLTSELVLSKFEEIDALQADKEMLSHIGNNAVREAAMTAQNGQLSELCIELGELALSIPAEQVYLEIGRLRDKYYSTTEKAKAQAASILDFGSKLATLLPFAASDISIKSAYLAKSSSSKIMRNEPIPQSDKDRLESLEIIEAALLKPVESDRVADLLLQYFDSAHEDNDTQQVYNEALYTTLRRPVTLNELIRQLQAKEPRARLTEYFTAFELYPVEVLDLAEAVYIFDNRPKNNKQTMTYVILNPKQRFGQITFSNLADNGLVLQHGWISYDDNSGSKTSRRKRVVRSIKTNSYSTESHTGEISDGNKTYIWEVIDHELLDKARAQ